MKKHHFVVIENKLYSNYPILIPLRDYLNKHENPPNNNTLEKELIEKGFFKIESGYNIIFIENNFKGDL